MAGDPYWKLYTGEWMKDECLSVCEPATRGIYLDWLCSMHNGLVDRLTGTARQLGRLGRCNDTEAVAALEDLRNTRTAMVSVREGVWTIISRRRRRELDISEGRRAAGSKGLAKRWQNRDSENESKDGSDSGELKFPDGFSLSFPEKFREWMVVRRAMGKKPKDWWKMFQAQMDWLKGFGETAAVEILSASIRNNWQGLHPLRLEPGKWTGVPPPRPGRAMSSFEIKERIAAIGEEINAIWRKAKIGLSGEREPTTEQGSEIARLKTRRTELRKEMTK